MRYKIRYKSHHDASRALKGALETGEHKGGYLAELLNSSAFTPRALYFHVPFCNKICSFCPFHRPDALKRREYHKYLIAEMERISRYEYMRAPLDAVYFGGGTPTAMTPPQMDTVLKAAKKYFDIPAGTEICTETSITELTDEMQSVLIENGVNRISAGVQSFDNATRKMLNRRGSGERAAEVVSDVIGKGLTNTGIDLIYNYPDQTQQSLQRDLDVIKRLGLSGVSFYSLMLHDKTPLSSRLSADEKARMADLLREKAFFDQILDELGKCGYNVFELTKLIRNGLDRYDYIRVRHSGGSCIAVGHGSGGNLDRYHYHNTHDAGVIGGGINISPRGRTVSPMYAVIDSFIQEMQCAATDLSKYSELTGKDLQKLFGDTLRSMQNDGLLTYAGARLELTRDGLFFSNNIIDELVQILVADIRRKKKC